MNESKESNEMGQADDNCGMVYQTAATQADGLVQGLTELGSVYAPESQNHRLVKWAVEEIVGLRARADTSRRERDDNSRYYAAALEEKARLVSKLRNGMELARLAMDAAA